MVDASSALFAQRQQVRDEVSRIQPFDEAEAQDQTAVLTWIDSGAPLWRVKKPATPDKHLVSYFLLVDGEYLLLVDHINAELWLPTGGHVELGEHPRETVRREAEEELGIHIDGLSKPPVFLTVTETVGKTAGHTDVSLWYVLEADRNSKMDFDTKEFHGIQWAHKNQVPWEQSDPHLSRFVDKYFVAQPDLG